MRELEASGKEDDAMLAKYRLQDDISSAKAKCSFRFFGTDHAANGQTPLRPKKQRAPDQSGARRAAAAANYLVFPAL
jgi:hypothetical protein